MSVRLSHRFVAVVVLIAVWSTTSPAQTTARVNGAINDTSNAVISGARITVRNVDNGIQRETASDTTGFYEVSLLQPGDYDITVQKEGFRQFTRERVRLEVNQVARIDFVLELGAVSETVDVQAAAPLLESSNSSIGQVIETKAVSDLPLNGRNFAQLAILSPGAIGVGYGPAGTIGSGSRPDDTRPGAELMVNGNREMSNNFTLDGRGRQFPQERLDYRAAQRGGHPRIQDPD